MINSPLSSSALSESQLWQCVELKLTAAAAGTVWSLIPEQRGASGKVRAVTGDGSIDLVTSAQAQEIVRPGSGSLSTEQTAIAAQLVTLLTNIPAAADGARAIVAVVGGLSGLGKVLCAEVSWCGVGTSVANVSTMLRVNGPAKVAESTTSVALSDGIVFWPKAECAVVAFALPDVADIPASGAPVSLKLWIKP